MAPELERALRNYLRLLSINPPHPANDRVRQIRTVAERSERTPQFSHLAKETKASFAKNPDREGDESWRFSVHHVLRRARIYTDALDGVPSEDLLQRFAAAFTRKEITTDILAPLESVQFSGDVCLDFDAFRVTKFSKEELSKVTESDTRDIFYPDSTLDMRLLSQYWWLVVRERGEPGYAGQCLSIKVDFGEQPVERFCREFPSSVHHALRSLVLYDWNCDRILADQKDIDRYLPEGQDGWFRFSLPFILRSGGSPFGPPDRAPDLSHLSLEPVFDPNGDEYGERPISDIHPGVTSFSRSIAEYESQLDTILDTIRSRNAQATEWHFVDVALSYLIKAFFADGLDQLLWHIAAIEALLGESQERLTETLARRCGLILGSSNEDRKRVRKSFKKLYDLRCDLVHGKTKQSNAQEGHLAIARNLARDVLIWFLQYLCFLAEDLPAGDRRLPKRAELLAALETKEDSRKRVSYLLSRVPGSFPRKRCWD